MKRPSAFLILRLTPLALLLAGCAIGPDFRRADVELPQALPAQFAEAEGWKPVTPATLPTPASPGEMSAWWAAFADPVLDELLPQVASANQNVQAALAQYRQAEGLTQAARAAWFPNLTSSLGANRTQATPGAATRSVDRLALGSAWELDVWGRIGRNVEAGEASSAASAADLAAIRLSAQAAFVQAYCQLRINDAQQRLLSATLQAYRRSLEITRNRYEAGVAGQADVAQAESQLKSTEAQAVELRLQRSQLEHALAVLLGRLPGTFSLAAVDSVPALPEIPGALPSTLLERRPDVAAAVLRATAANAQIGVARAAFFPTLSLSASGGYQATTFTNLLSTPNRFWSLGPAFALTLFDAGARAATVDQAEASYDRTVATYRQTVLTAFQEVEDNLAALRYLDEEREAQRAATRAANQFQMLTNNQYLAGTVSFLNVATAQATALAAERSSLDLQGRHLIAAVNLFKALGGGNWLAENQAARGLTLRSDQGSRLLGSSAAP